MADEADVETPAAPPRGAKKTPRGARARIEVEGDVDQGTVDRVMGAAGRDTGNARSSTPRGESQKFERAIRNTENTIFAKRIFPPKMADGTPLGDELELFPTGSMTKDQVRNEIREQRGGQKWHVRVLDENDKIVAADTIVVPGEPMMDPMMVDVGDLGGRGGSRRGGTGMTEPFAPGFETEQEDPLANDPDIIKARKRVEIAKIQADEEEHIAKLAEARARRAMAERALKADENGNGNGHARKDDEDDFDTKLTRALETNLAPLRDENKRLREKDEERENRSERKQELEAILGPLKLTQDSQQKALENILTKLNAPPPPPPPAFDQDKFFNKLESMETKLRGEMEKGVTAAITGLRDKYDGQFNSINDKLTQALAQPKNDAATTALVQLATRPSGGGGAADPFALVAKATEAMRSLAETRTVMTGGGSTTPPDFPSYLVEKTTDMVPEVLGFLERRAAAGGGLPSREELDNMMKQHGVKMYEGLSKELKDGIGKVYESVNRRMGNMPPSNPGGMPAVAAPPGMQPGAPPPPSAPPVAAAAVHTAAPAPAPVAFPGAAAPPVTAPPSQVVGNVPLNDQYKARTNWVLKGVLHEIQLGIAGMKWPEKAYNELPRDIIEKVALSENSDQVMDAIRPYAEPALLDQLGSFLAESHPKYQFNRKWLTAGINWIKDAYESEGEEAVAEDQPEAGG